jgi:tryptophan synthase alpha chain
LNPAEHPIDQTFRLLQAQKRKAFIPFITAGDPDLASTESIIRGMAGVGADIIEIGFPFSDPVADGPTIQASYTRALDHGLKIDPLLAMLGRVSREARMPPLVGMVSFSIIWRKEPAVFFQACQSAGLAGLIVPDLPVEEIESVTSLAREHDIKLILLVTPTTTDERIRAIAEVCGGFLYCVSLVGITGERNELPPGIGEYLARLRSLTTLPLCVGFGVSKPVHARLLAEQADGVIVGSALVRFLERNDQAGMLALARDLRDALGGKK